MSAAVLTAIASGCTADQPHPSNPSDKASAATPSGAPTNQAWFSERAAAVGLDFVHFNGMSGRLYFPEVMPPGVALVDFDNDGDLDVYFVQGQLLGPGVTPAQALIPAVGEPRGRLFRNDLTVAADGTRRLHFTDVTETSGIEARVYGMGVAVGDIDNDGFPDLYLTNFGRNQLFRNNGNGTFTDISQSSGTDAAGFFVSATFFDYDRDGRLDLFVGGYVDYALENDKPCPSVSGGPGYCPPRAYRSARDHLYHNNGNGRFTDVTGRALLGGEFGPALGVVAADFNDDGWPDLYVTNDGHENQLWINQRNGTFRNDALAAGVALTVDGQAEGSMGVDAGDFDNDGDEDLLMTELTGEGSNLFVNLGKGIFEDRSVASGLGPASLELTGFGTGWADFDNDGWLDVLSANGLVQMPPGAGRAVFPLGQPMLLLQNKRNGRFDRVAHAGDSLERREVGRGAAFGDIDNDGDVDVLVGNDAGPARLLINEIGSHNHWVGVRLLGRDAPRDMLGARVDFLRADGTRLRRRAHSDGSYASASDPRVLVGLGSSADRPRIRVTWPNGQTEEWADVAIDQWTTLRQGDRR